MAKNGYWVVCYKSVSNPANARTFYARGYIPHQASSVHLAFIFLRSPSPPLGIRAVSPGGFRVPKTRSDSHYSWLPLVLGIFLATHSVGRWSAISRPIGLSSSEKGKTRRHWRLGLFGSRP